MIGGLGKCDPTTFPDNTSIVLIELVDSSVDPMTGNPVLYCYNFGYLKGIMFEQGQGLMKVDIPNTDSGMVVPIFTSGTTVTLLASDVLDDVGEILTELKNLKLFKVYVDPSSSIITTLINVLKIYDKGVEYSIYPQDQYGRTTGVITNLKVNVSTSGGIGRVDYQIRFDIGKAYNELTVTTV